MYEGTMEYVTLFKNRLRVRFRNVNKNVKDFENLAITEYLFIEDQATTSKPPQPSGEQSPLSTPPQPPKEQSSLSTPPQPFGEKSPLSTRPQPSGEKSSLSTPPQLSGEKSSLSTPISDLGFFEQQYIAGSEILSFEQFEKNRLSIIKCQWPYNDNTDLVLKNPWTVQKQFSKDMFSNQAAVDDYLRNRLEMVSTEMIGQGSFGSVWKISLFSKKGAQDQVWCARRLLVKEGLCYRKVDKFDETHCLSFLPGAVVLRVLQAFRFEGMGYMSPYLYAIWFNKSPETYNYAVEEVGISFSKHLDILLNSFCKVEIAVRTLMYEIGTVGVLVLYLADIGFVHYDLNTGNVVVRQDDSSYFRFNYIDKDGKTVIYESLERFRPFLIDFDRVRRLPGADQPYTVCCSTSSNSKTTRKIEFQSNLPFGHKDESEDFRSVWSPQRADPKQFPYDPSKSLFQFTSFIANVLSRQLDPRFSSYEPQIFLQQSLSELLTIQKSLIQCVDYNLLCKFVFTLLGNDVRQVNGAYITKDDISATLVERPNTLQYPILNLDDLFKFWKTPQPWIQIQARSSIVSNCDAAAAVWWEAMIVRFLHFAPCPLPRTGLSSLWMNPSRPCSRFGTSGENKHHQTFSNQHHQPRSLRQRRFSR